MDASNYPTPMKARTCLWQSSKEGRYKIVQIRATKEGLRLDGSERPTFWRPVRIPCIDPRTESTHLIRDLRGLNLERGPLISCHSAALCLAKKPSSQCLVSWARAGI